MKMMMALRWTSTPTTPMMNRAAVRASDSASTDRFPAAEDHSAGNGDEQHHAEHEHHHDRAGIDEHLHDADELRIKHHVQRGEAEHGVDEPECGRHRALASHERQRRSEGDHSEEIEMEDVKERVVRLHYWPFGSSGSHISQTGCV